MTSNKKPDFNDLNLSKITGSEKVPETEKPKPSPWDEGYVLNGKSLRDLTSEEFVEWLNGLFPGHDFSAIASKVSTVKDRERTITKIMYLYTNILPHKREDLVC